jgi:hypothetical protein
MSFSYAAAFALVFGLAPATPAEERWSAHFETSHRIPLAALFSPSPATLPAGL